MIVSDLKIYEYNVPLKMPLKVLGKPVSNRQGLILKLISAGQHAGFGEIANIVAV